VILDIGPLYENGVYGTVTGWNRVSQLISLDRIIQIIVMRACLVHGGPAWLALEPGRIGVRLGIDT
jgi:hypothetical protein